MIEYVFRKQTVTVQFFVIDLSDILGNLKSLFTVNKPTVRSYETFFDAFTSFLFPSLRCLNDQRMSESSNDKSFFDSVTGMGRQSLPITVGIMVCGSNDILSLSKTLSTRGPITALITSGSFISFIFYSRTEPTSTEIKMFVIFSNHTLTVM